MFLGAPGIVARASQLLKAHPLLLADCSGAPLHALGSVRTGHATVPLEMA